MTKMVDGKEIICSPEEEARIRAEWAKNDAEMITARKKADEKKQSVENIKQSIINNPSGVIKNSDLKVLLEALGV